MGLKEGTLESLVNVGCSAPIGDLARTALHHMLQAIDFLAVQGIIHRDLKPANILYTCREGEYQFQLGDFGLSTRQVVAVTFSGSPLYMAPEMFSNQQQTHKVDVWSLYVTMLWTLDVCGFRQASRISKSLANVQRDILNVASSETAVSPIREMASPDPEERASAAQMLVEHYDGEGLATPRNRVPPLATRRPHAATSSRNPTTWARSTGPRNPLFGGTGSRSGGGGASQGSSGGCPMELCTSSR